MILTFEQIDDPLHLFYAFPLRLDVVLAYALFPSSTVRRGTGRHRNSGAIAQHQHMNRSMS